MRFALAGAVASVFGALLLGGCRSAPWEGPLRPMRIESGRVRTGQSAAEVRATISAPQIERKKILNPGTPSAAEELHWFYASGDGWMEVVLLNGKVARVENRPRPVRGMIERIKIGMPEAGVRAALGKPVRRVPESTKKPAQWLVYADGGAQAEELWVSFSKGKVASWNPTPLGEYPRE